MKTCKPSCCSAQGSCVAVLLRLGRVVTNVAFYHVTMKPNSQKNDARCEYTRGAPEPPLLQIPIHI